MDNVINNHILCFSFKGTTICSLKGKIDFDAVPATVMLTTIQNSHCTVYGKVNLLDDAKPGDLP